MSALVSSFSQAEIVHPGMPLSVQDQRISDVVAGESRRLRRFIARYVVDRAEAEDILQDVFYELVDAYRLTKSIEQAGAWLLRVARNRIIDRFRKQRQESLTEASIMDDEGELFTWDEFLPDAAAGPEQAWARDAMLQHIENALANLSPAQREVFIAHELEGRSFNEMSAQSGVSVNTLLSRKHEAVIALRKQLQWVYEELL